MIKCPKCGYEFELGEEIEISEEQSTEEKSTEETPKEETEQV